MKTRTELHYINLLKSNEHASIGLSLAAQAVYSSRFTWFNPNDSDYHHYQYSNIYHFLKSTYGESLNVDQVRYEMKNIKLFPEMYL